MNENIALFFIVLETAVLYELSDILPSAFPRTDKVRVWTKGSSGKQQRKNIIGVEMRGIHLQTPTSIFTSKL